MFILIFRSFCINGVSWISLRLASDSMEVRLGSLTSLLCTTVSPLPRGCSSIQSNCCPENVVGPKTTSSCYPPWMPCSGENQLEKQQNQKNNTHKNRSHAYFWSCFLCHFEEVFFRETTNRAPQAFLAWTEHEISVTEHTFYFEKGEENTMLFLWDRGTKLSCTVTAAFCLFPMHLQNIIKGIAQSIDPTLCEHSKFTKFPSSKNNYCL